MVEVDSFVSPVVAEISEFSFPRASGARGHKGSS